MVEAKKTPIILIGTEDKVLDEMKSHFKSARFSARPCVMGQGQEPMRIEAAVVYANGAEDLAKMKDFLVRFQNVPIVTFLGCTPPKEFSKATQIQNKKGFKTSVPEVCGDLSKRISEAKLDISKVFQQFDKDKSGFIDKSELAVVVAELNQSAGNERAQFGDHDINNMIRDLDINGDGLISPEEFNLWWLNGRRGFTGKMSKLIMAKAASAKKKADSVFKNLVTEAEAKPYEEICNSLEASINGGEATSSGGTSIYVKVSAMTDECVTVRKSLEATLGEQLDLGMIAHVSVQIKPCGQKAMEKVFTNEWVLKLMKMAKEETHATFSYADGVLHAYFLKNEDKDDYGYEEKTDNRADISEVFKN